MKRTRLNLTKLEKLIAKKYGKKSTFVRALMLTSNNNFLNLQQQLSKILGRQEWWCTDTTLEMYCKALDCETKNLKDD